MVNDGPKMDVSECRGCGRPMIWGITDEGRKIPLDKMAPVYVIVGEAIEDRVMVKRHKTAYVNHFVTCAKANDFHKRRDDEQT